MHDDAVQLMVSKLHSVRTQALRQLDLGRQAESWRTMQEVWHVVATSSSTHWKRRHGARGKVSSKATWP